MDMNLGKPQEMVKDRGLVCCSPWGRKARTQILTPNLLCFLRGCLTPSQGTLSVFATSHLLRLLPSPGDVGFMTTFSHAHS